VSREPSKEKIVTAESSTAQVRTTIAGIPDLVGKELGTSSWRTISQDDVNTFADLTGDHNPIHIDAAAAARSPFGTTIVHGYLTVSLVVPLMAEVFEVTDLGTGINYGLDKLRFPAPVPVGSRIRASVRLTEATEVAGGVQAKFDVTFEVEGQAKPACVMTMVVRYYA
jgi:acyl dehydratase